MKEPERRIVRGLAPVDGGEIWYEMSGHGEPTVVLLHAGLLTCDMWDAQFELLQEHCRVVRYDARGHGRSTLPDKDFSHHADLHQLIEHLELGCPMLVGLSLGARTAVDFLLTFPDRVSCQLLASPGLSGWDFRDPAFARPRARLRAACERRDWDRAAAEFAAMWVYGPARAADQISSVLRGRFEATIATTLRRTAGWSGKLLEAGAVERLSDLEVRSTIVVGELDAQGIRNIGEAIAASSPRHRLLRLPDAGHLLNLEAEARFNAILLDCHAEARK